MPPSTIKSERRKKSRNRPPSLVYVELPSGNGGMMRDLSEEGFAVRAMLPLRAGELTPFSFSLNQSMRIEGEGEILWIKENGRVAGVRFTQVSATARTHIHDWMNGPQDSPRGNEIPAKPVAPAASTLDQLREEIRSVPSREDSPKAIRAVPPPPAPETVPAASEIIPSTPPPGNTPPPVNTSPPENTPPGLHASVLGDKTKELVPEIPSRSPALPVPPLRPPEATAAISEVIPSTPPPENISSPEVPSLGLHASLLGDKTKAPAPEVPAGLPAPPVQPALPPAPNAIESTFEPLPWAPMPLHGAPISKGHPNPLPPSDLPDLDVKTPKIDPPLPDISEILIQPSRMQIGHSPNSSAHESLLSGERAAETHVASWTDRFTLSRALTIMMFLTLLAAASVFHRDVGQTLIWLGEQMGGVQVGQSQLSASNDVLPAGNPIESSSNSSNSPSQRSTSAKPTTQDHRTATGAAAQGKNSQASLSSIAKNAAPPVTPLSGVSAPTSSDASEESGQGEYVQAMQLLRGKNTGADSSEVVRLLWISVEKGNPSAEVALADLYWNGQGVARNCDQTRILLTAAARKGSAEGQKRLQQFQREGCE